MKPHQIIKDKELIHSIESLAIELGIQFKGRTLEAVQASISEALSNI
jgi:hypothetical protein